MVTINEDLFKKQILDGFTIGELQKYYKCSKGTIANYKIKWKLIGISPNNTPRDNGDGTKFCKLCETNKPLSCFYSNGYSQLGHKKYKPGCKLCENNIRYNNNLIKVYDILKEQNRFYKCELCGYNKNSAALCFHHKTSEKNFDINSNGLNKKKRNWLMKYPYVSYYVIIVIWKCITHSGILNSGFFSPPEIYIR